MKNKRNEFEGIFLEILSVISFISLTFILTFIIVR